MEVAQLARLVVLLIAALKAEGALQDAGTNPGRTELLGEIKALTQLHTERTRAQAGSPIHNTPRGKALLDRAEAAEPDNKEAASADAPEARHRRKR